VSDDPLVRLEVGYSVFTNVIKDVVEPPAGARRGDCVLAVAAFQPPGHCVGNMLPPETRKLNQPDPDASDLDRWLYSGSVLAAHDLAETHWHVGPVAVEPGFQGRGLGRAVMKLLCDRFDERGELAWLETDKPENVTFYVSLGFEVTEEVPMLSARFWFMRRDPR
jgi:ribosomal protein S18 acetylase RimI-like enzyme